MPVWEYRSVRRGEDQLLTDEQLNKMGAHGFELVSVLALREESMVVGRRETRTVVHYFFKRPKTDAKSGG